MKRYFPPILWMIVIFILSSIPGSEFPKEPFSGFSVLVHLVEYSILGMLWYRVLKKKFIVVLIIGMLYGISDEIHQLFVPFREFSVLDMIADAAGVIIGVITGKRIWH